MPEWMPDGKDAVIGDAAAGKLVCLKAVLYKIAYQFDAACGCA
jgi:hypothetical protein